ncbi:MAG: thermonuclease family protein [Deltaproteobacteria bacterium]|jgi:endonuclease YncB( thermonuclease family)|nr:thermonuclease family protein [Deltaproteobacteria bacterium]
MARAKTGHNGVLRLLFPRGKSKSLLSLLLALLAAVGAYSFAPGRVIRVADGDTLTMFSPEREMLKVRLYGVDAPESDQPGGKEARAFASDLALLHEVEVRTLDTDRYGRSVGMVRLTDGRMLNEELVRAGLAWVYLDYCREIQCVRWLALEKEARAAGRGLWKRKNPVPPWEWRAGHRRGSADS